MRLRDVHRVLILSISLLCTPPLLAHELAPPDGSDASRKRLQVPRSELSPNLDGVLDDPIWREAAVISDLHQFQPVDQGEPSERSEFYIIYNERFLYIGARLYDSDPSAISARQ